MQTVSIENVVVRFVGDSGDGMQLVGTQFTLASAVAGNDLATLPDFPAEIRAPAGTTYGVSGFQLQVAQGQAFTPDDQPHVLVTMNPAGLKANLNDLPHGAVIIANRDAFTGRNVKLAGYTSHPLEDGSLDGYQVFPVPMTQLTVDAIAESGLKPKEAKRCTNFFALGLICWLYSRSLEPTLQFIDKKFAKHPQLVVANRAALKTGHAYGDTMEAFAAPFAIEPADIPGGEYRTINGNQALVMGLVTAAAKADRDLVFAGYPITPASSLLEDLAALKSLGVRLLQAEDKIAVAATLGIGGSTAAPRKFRNSGRALSKPISPSAA